MGIESDQLVYDYLSRVGDLAQQRQLPSGTRMRLVSRLREEIDRGRAKAAADNPASIRRILARLGTPEEVVESAGGTQGSSQGGTQGGPRSGSGGGAPGDDSGDIPTARSTPRPAVPTQRGPRSRPRFFTSEPSEPSANSGSSGSSGDPENPDAPKGLRRMVPRPRRTAAGEPAEAETEAQVERPSPPHLAGTDELGPSGSEPDWWRVDSGPFGFADSVPGFVGGVEIPEILKPPPSPDDERGPRLRKGDPLVDEDEEEGEDEEEEATEDEGTGRRRWRLPRPRAAVDGGAAFSNPLLLLAAALLTVGAILGNWLALGGGWLIAYASRKLSRAEAKWAALGLPGLSVAAGMTWLWGRSDGRWGDPIKEGHMSDAIAGTWPWVVRGAAVASALFLLWRSQRRRH
ncbi:hypothetical protein [Streptomyces sp. NPDC087300]|uniref:hypothetical protein n=1 Tax=Streptomyces sp. NPDC087300 TaxID=3365780 RepID=UPI0038184540